MKNFATRLLSGLRTDIMLSNLLFSYHVFHLLKAFFKSCSSFSEIKNEECILSQVGNMTENLSLSSIEKNNNLGRYLVKDCVQVEDNVVGQFENSVLLLQQVRPLVSSAHAPHRESLAVEPRISALFKEKMEKVSLALFDH